MTALNTKICYDLKARYYFSYFVNKKEDKCMESLIPVIINLISGAVGGNVAGKLFKNLNLGTLLNSVAGIVGGGLGGQLLGILGIGGGGSMDLVGIIQSIAAGGVGGGVLMAIVGFFKKLMK